MAHRPTHPSLIEARAQCERCAWSTAGANAQALAAQHFDKKGHRVRVTLINEIVYGHVSGTAKGEKQGSFAL